MALHYLPQAVENDTRHSLSGQCIIQPLLKGTGPLATKTSIELAGQLQPGFAVSEYFGDGVSHWQ